MDIWLAGREGGPRKRKPAFASAPSALSVASAPSASSVALDNVPRRARSHLCHQPALSSAVAGGAGAACASPAPLSPTLLTVLTIFSSVLRILIILLPARPSRLNVISMPNTRRKVCARPRRPTSAGFFQTASDNCPIRAVRALLCRVVEGLGQQFRSQGPHEATVDLTESDTSMTAANGRMDSG